MRRLVRPFRVPPRAALVGVTGLALLGAGASAARTTAVRSAPTVATPSAPEPIRAGPALAVRATNRLALDLLDRIAPGADAVISPTSIETTLAMVDQGTDAAAATALDRLLGGADSPATLAAANRALTAGLRAAVRDHGRSGPRVSAADGLWVQAGSRLESPFTDVLADDFGAAAVREPFSTDPAGALAAINLWCDEHTGGRIAQLLAPSEVTDRTRLVLADAVTLTARWRVPFDPNQTQSGDFAAAGGAVQVPYMNSGHLSRFPYAAGAGYSAVALPYADSSLQLLLVLPSRSDLAGFEATLDPARLATIARALASAPVDVVLPRFTLSTRASLVPALTRLGAGALFAPRAPLTRILAGPALGISALTHAATISVGEAGTTAAAATGAVGEPTAIFGDDRSFVADRPFLAFVRDRVTGAILYAVRVANPAG